MSDWIDDFFDAVEEGEEREITEGMPSRLVYLLRCCRYEDNVHEDYEWEILSSELTMNRYQELSATFEMNKLDVRYDYAPSQRDLAKFIRMICDL
jgi:hypothetical protein